MGILSNLKRIGSQSGIVNIGICRMQENFAGFDGFDTQAVAEQPQQSTAPDLVRAALDRGDVVLAFQPVVQARRPDRPAFYEGLIRVIDEAGHVIPARDFVPAVEATELGRRIDCAALDLGLTALARTPALRLSINMSARSITDARWMRTLTGRLDADPTLGERLILEITEASALMMPATVALFMQSLQARGICFALDDFGAGATAFRYLKDFGFDILKIDGQFIQGIHNDGANQTLTRALVSIARHFDMMTVAEFVDSPQDAELLPRLGIDCMQGYHFGAPTITPAFRNMALRACDTFRTA